MLASVNEVTWTDGARNTSLSVNMPAALPSKRNLWWVCAQRRAVNTDESGQVEAGLSYRIDLMCKCRSGFLHAGKILFSS